MNLERANEIYYWLVRTIQEHEDPITEGRLLRLSKSQSYLSHEVREVIADSLNVGRLYQPTPNKIAYVEAY